MSLRALDPLLQTDEQTLHTEFVAYFYELLTQSIHPPYAISLDGLWGAGKTTIMRILQEKLAAAGYPVFWYNPWKYRQTDSVVLAFLQSLYLTSADKKFLTEMNKQSATILRVLLESGLDAGLKIITQGTFTLKDWPLAFTGHHAALKTIEQEFIELLLAISRYHASKAVIIFIDDLDRCLPTDVIHFLEALKNLFITRGSKAIFICGLDTQIAKQFIADHYRGVFESPSIVNYFHKIFNLTLSMPYSANIQEILRQYIAAVYAWEDPACRKAEDLAKMVYVRGVQTQIYSLGKYLKIVTNFYTFLKFNPAYEFQSGNDFIVNLLIFKEAWQPLYEALIAAALKERANMGQLIQRLLAQQRLTAEQEKFLTAYFGQETPFAKEHLALWIAKHPTLA